MNELLPFNTSPLPVRLRVEDYLLLDESGAFEAYAKTELIEGEIFYMNAQHRPHAGVKMRLFVALSDQLRALSSAFVPIVEVSVSMPPGSVPEPDIVVTSEPDGEGLVPLASVGLVVEVADTTLSHDLRRKAALYARVGVPEYWVADVRGRSVTQFWRPVDGAYAERRAIAFGEPIVSVAIEGLAISTSTL
jgi:Uma2 family endonuclease